MNEIEKNGFNLNISRYVSTAAEEEIIDLSEVILFPIKMVANKLPPTALP